MLDGRRVHESLVWLARVLGPDVKFNLIKDENLGGNEPDCETNHERPERE